MVRSSVHRDAVLLQLLFRSRIIRREREREIRINVIEQSLLSQFEEKRNV